MESIESVIDRIRQPEYTGENRCIPCTVLNVGIAFILAGAIALYFPTVGVGALIGSLLVIYIRGYLVPGTPELTSRYLPEPVLQAFGKTPSGAGPDVGTSGTPEADAEEIESLLRSAAIVKPTEDGDLKLTGDFREVWWRRIERYRGDIDDARVQIASVLDIDPSEVTIETGEQCTVSYEGQVIGRWPSNAAFYADLGVEPTLTEWLPEWEQLSDRRRTELIAGMRALLTECPACDAELSQVEDVRKSCCSTDFVSVSVDCPDCGARVFSGSYR